MAKQVQHNRVASGDLAIERNVAYDDSPLPSADELSRLKAVDNSIPQWLMDKADKEQDARIKFNQDRMKLAQSDSKHAHIYSYIALIMAYSIVLIFLLLSFYLILQGEILIGSIFVGGTIGSIVFYFLNSKKRK